MTEKRVRTADRSDEGEIMDMCRMLHEENGLFSLNERKVRDVLGIAFDHRGGTLGVIGSPGSIEAMIFMLIVQGMWYTDEWHLEELFSYVRPECRRSENAKLLIQFAKQSSIELGIPLVIGIISNTKTEQKVRLYQRQFSKPNGAFFVFGGKWNGPIVASGHG